MNLTLVVGILVLGVGKSPSGTCQAAITQQISFTFDPTPDDLFNNDDVRGGDFISGNTPTDINRSLIAGLNDNGVSASGSVGEFGNYGLQASTSRTGELRAQVVIEADVQAPPIGGSPREAFANFIIDGGQFVFVAGENSTLEFILTLSADRSAVFQSALEMTGSPGGNTPTLTQFGADIGAEQNGSTVDIPFSFQNVSLGVLNPGQSILLEYQLDIIADIQDFSEVTIFEFQDPLSVEPPLATIDQLRPTISFVSAVPEPSFAMIGLVACGIVMVSRKRPGRARK
ncbi:hypothetical protein [Stieleria mannarensis]|uniref:hypothetical protein n=1 Tax=Stieleria mannarensis TaxID=2755585 RepID=UPI0016039EDD|nr:hypothetical protein [Rhodopirellula sp. JC639]